MPTHIRRPSGQTLALLWEERAREGLTCLLWRLTKRKENFTLLLGRAQLYGQRALLYPMSFLTKHS